MAKDELWNAFDAVVGWLKPNFPSPKKVLRVTSLGASQIPLWNNHPMGHTPEVAEFHSCPDPQLSCKVEFNSQDTCCFNYPGGQLLQVQLWDVDPPRGPEDGWTIHGLWPDHCDGSFDQFCDDSRRHQNISAIIEQSGKMELLDLMRARWKNIRGDDEHLWIHEWNKHGTCISTLEPRCYPDYVPQQEVVTYFQKTVDLFLKLPSHEILSAAGIVPSETETYYRDAIESALKKAHGQDVRIKCQHGMLSEISYNFNVAGPLELGIFIPASPVGAASNCPLNGIRYRPKKTSRREPSPTKTFPEPTGAPPTGSPFVDDFFLKSSKGLCAFDDDDGFICSADVDNPTAFTAMDELLSLGEQTVFYSDVIPRRRGQSPIYKSSEQHPLSLEIHWREA
ncbi:ribonuclease T2 precursor [Histoplasma mississippiense (nom. inval.)]|uniref:ribonuclease T2 precursor n=1 Tax=Ajellomyces capsulatus (strain NAm1 / WU24) TaxID=2059318 RepID=UPI000157C87E|nr:ribonuclease T2 precursor [Histoplasma mississippiense (nom. inval.)]EDN09401.1 ribonuclease T2 precursor [Histoplasma mississippiense (nom. inval.)]